MTPAERESMYIANCRICTLAQVMRDCPKCLFNIGLTRVIKAQSGPIKAQEAQTKEEEIKSNG
jgi:hypothetical protein